MYLYKILSRFGKTVGFFIVEIVGASLMTDTHFAHENEQLDEFETYNLA